jgi:hypothetical protein
VLSKHDRPLSKSPVSVSLCLCGENFLVTGSLYSAVLHARFIVRRWDDGSSVLSADEADGCTRGSGAISNSWLSLNQVAHPNVRW